MLPPTSTPVFGSCAPVGVDGVFVGVVGVVGVDGVVVGVDGVVAVAGGSGGGIGAQASTS